MDQLATQIISGSVVALISFSFGYFLFRFQTSEQIRLEVFRRRLDSYSAIASFLEELDTFSHGDDFDDTDKRREFVMKNYKLNSAVDIYVSSDISLRLQNLSEFIDGGDDVLGELEYQADKIWRLMANDVDQHLPNLYGFYASFKKTKQKKGAIQTAQTDEF